LGETAETERRDIDVAETTVGDDRDSLQKNAEGRTTWKGGTKVKLEAEGRRVESN